MIFKYKPINYFIPISLLIIYFRTGNSTEFNRKLNIIKLIALNNNYEVEMFNPILFSHLLIVVNTNKFINNNNNFLMIK